MKTQPFGRRESHSVRYFYGAPTCSVLAHYRAALHKLLPSGLASLKDYRENRENGESLDEPPRKFPSAGLDTLKVKDADWQGSSKWPDNQRRYWLRLILEDGTVREDYYWMPDYVRGYPDKADSECYWFSVHHAPSSTKIEGFSVRPDREKGYPDEKGYYWTYVQYNGCGPIQQWMQEKDKNYLARLQREKELEQSKAAAEKHAAEEKQRQEQLAAERLRLAQMKELEDRKLRQESEERAAETKRLEEARLAAENAQRLADAEKKALEQERLRAEQEKCQLEEQRRKVEKEKASEVAAQPKPPSSPLPPIPVVKPKEIVKALYDYSALDSGQLSFAKEDVLTLLKESEAGWWHCADAQGKEGWIPSNYVTKITSEMVKPKESNQIKDDKGKEEIFSLNSRPILDSTKPSSSSGSSNSSSSIDAFKQLNFYIPYDDITLGRLLGRGGYGEVFEGDRHGEKVAVKKLYPHKMLELDKFKQEAQIMASLHFDYIVTFKGVCVEPYCIVMQYMPGGSLYGVLHSPAMLPWSIRHGIALDVAKGLTFLHMQKPVIIHRDLTSHNVLLTADYQCAKLTDFGIAKIWEEFAAYYIAKELCGSLAWTAPECLENKYSVRSDMYSYGMILWALVSRKTPYQELPMPAILGKLHRGECEEIPNEMTQLSDDRPTAKTPQSIKDFIRLCWFKETAKRPTAQQAVKAFEQDIEKVLAPENSDPELLDSSFVENVNSSSSSNSLSFNK